jgi:hypothetical protein
VRRRFSLYNGLFVILMLVLLLFGDVGVHVVSNKFYVSRIYCISLLNKKQERNTHHVLNKQNENV